MDIENRDHMALDPATKDLLRFLKNNPSLRAQVKAPHNKTLLYSGRFIQAAWKDIELEKLRDPSFRQKVTLPDVIGKIRASNPQFPTLLSWVQSIDKIQPWRVNGFFVWRALSGIFAANASGQVSFAIGSGVTNAEKVFAATELQMLLRNPKLDSLTRELLFYYDRCIKSGNSEINVAFYGGL